MTKPKILVALLCETPGVERIVIRRRFDELFLFFTDEEQELALTLIDKFSALGIPVIPIHTPSLNFSNALSSILRALNHRSLDDYDVEFSIASGNPVMILACSIAAAIVNASISYTDGNCLIELSELWPAKLVNVTHKKKQILDFLENAKGPINQKEISKETGICLSSISRHIRDLEMAGFVTRTRVAKKKKVQISELGSTILHHKQIRKRRLWGSYTMEPSTGIQTVS